jgi:hypothetical protein
MRNLALFILLVTTFFRGQAQTLPIPAVAAGQGNNYFVAGTGDGGSLTTYNSFLRLHYGLAIGSPFTSNGSGGYVEKATISFDGRSGNISTLGSIGIGKAPQMNLDILATGDYQGIQLYHTSGRWTRLYSSLPIWSFNGITGQNDSGIIFGNLGGTVNNGFVIAPHQGATSGLRVDQNGNVGIGTPFPSWQLEAGGTGSGKGIIMASGDEAFVGWYDRSLKSSSTNNRWGWYANNGSTHLWDNLNSANRLTISNNGNVGIGTTDPKGYKLAVAGKAIAEEVTVKLQANWPDYVFEPTYHLSPLDSIKTYIDKNKHLPEVPSAKEMEKNGVNLGEMNMLLLKKIEELTLYQIEANRKIEMLQKQVETLITKK